MTTDTAPRRPTLLDERADDSAVWLARRAGVPAVWARYTDLVVDRGEGSWIVTQDGDRYLDYTCGIGVTNTGHAHPRVAAAIADQAGEDHPRPAEHPLSQARPRAPRAAAALLPRRRADDEGAAEIGLFLSNSGAEAIEAAVKLAKIATHRPAIVAFRGGFHGRTHGTMSLTSSAIKNRGHYEPLLGQRLLRAVPVPAAHAHRARRREAALAWTMSQLDELFATLVFAVSLPILKTWGTPSVHRPHAVQRSGSILTFIACSFLL